MSDVLYQCAKSFEKVMQYNYLFAVGNYKNLYQLNLNCLQEDFTHIVGLDHLKDINKLSTHNSKIKNIVFNEILSNKVTFNSIKSSIYFNVPFKMTFNSKTGREYTISDRLRRLSNIENILDNAYKGKILKWNVNKCNVLTHNRKYRNIKINADYLLTIPSETTKDEKIYLFAYVDQEKSKKKDQPIVLNVHSAFADCVDLTQGQERPYTILQETRIDVKTNKRTELYIAPSYKKQLDNEKKEISQRASEQGKNNPYEIYKDKGYTVLKECKNKEIVTAEIPAGVQWIDTEAFAGCYNLENVIIPDGVEGIAQAAFYGCENLESVEISDSVARVGDYAFAECKNLWNVNVPADLLFDGERCDFDKVFSGTPFLEEWQNGNGDNLNNTRGR